jgi:hypothetical protein
VNSSGLHTGPAEVEVAPLAFHVRATSIFFDADLALWALSHVFAAKVTEVGSAVLSAPALVPWLLTLEAGPRLAFRAGYEEV